MILAIVGSRDFQDLPFMLSKVDSILSVTGLPAEIISGGQRGADTLSEAVARHLGIPHRHIHADWKQYGRRAGPIRNAQVVAEADVIIAFPIGESKGTRDAISKARKAGKRVFIHES